MKGRWLWLLTVVGLASMVGGCVVETTDCPDNDGDLLCDDGEDPCLGDPDNTCDGCTDTDGDTVCDAADPCPTDPEDLCDLCPDDDGDGLCDDDGEDPCPGDPENLCGDVCFYDGDADGICDDVDDCIGDEGDDDGDGVCNGEDLGSCIDDVTLADTCADDCIPITDNYCGSAWDLTYCAEQDLNWYVADCHEACTTDQAVWGDQAGCAEPAILGECYEDTSGAACLCYCQDQFDQCIPGTETVQYTRDGTTYEVDCKEYCFGTCDEAAGACACP